MNKGRTATVTPDFKDQRARPIHGIYNVKEKSSLPLKNICFDVIANGSIMELAVTQEYTNNINNPIECEYIFPVGTEIAVNRVVIRKGEHVITTTLYDKRKGELIYGEEIKKGHNPLKVLYKGDMQDILSLYIGKLEVGATLLVELRLIIQLSFSDNAYQIRIPISYTPLHSTISPHNKLATSLWTLKLQILAPKPILFVKSNDSSHKMIKLSYTDDHKTAFGEISRKQAPKTDILVSFAYLEMWNPYAMLQWNSKLNEFAALVTLSPNSRTYVKEEIERVVYNENELLRRHVFLLDCSSSMKGSKFEMAKQTCRMMLKNLPTNSYFNIIAFGSDIHVLFGNSLRCTQTNINRAYAELEQLSATMGKAKIDDQFISLFKSYAEGFTYYFITGGLISHPKSIIVRIRNSDYRVHTIGIGLGADKRLIKLAIWTGRGQFIYITEPDEIKVKIYQFITKESIFSLSNPTFSWGVHKKDILYQFPERDKMPNVYSNEPFVALAIFKHLPVEFTATFRAIDITDNTVKLIKHKFNARNILVGGEGLFKLLIKQLLSYNEKLAYINKSNVSIKYSVLNKRTAFIGTQRITQKSNIRIPSKISNLQYLQDRNRSKIPRRNANTLPVRKISKKSSKSQFKTIVSNYRPTVHAKRTTKETTKRKSQSTERETPRRTFSKGHGSRGSSEQALRASATQKQVPKKAPLKRQYQSKTINIRTRTPTHKKQVTAKEKVDLDSKRRSKTALRKRPRNLSKTQNIKRKLSYDTVKKKKQERGRSKKSTSTYPDSDEEMQGSSNRKRSKTLERYPSLNTSDVKVNIRVCIYAHIYIYIYRI